MAPTIIAVIPAYNAEETLYPLLQQVSAFLPIGDILVVNDGSTDQTGDIAFGFGCRLISFPANHGKGAALRCGFSFAMGNDYDAVLTLDADLQHPPEYIPYFLDRFDDADVIIGTREISLPLMPPGRIFNNTVTSLVISIFGNRRIRDSQSGYRLIKTRFLRKLRLAGKRYDLESELLFQAGVFDSKIIEIPIATVYNTSASHINPLLDTGRFLKLVWNRVWY